MSDRKWTILLAIGLIGLSAVLYLLHLAIFHDPHHIGIYLVGDLAFLPIEVLLVTIILHSLLEHRDRQQKLEKMNMVIGTFFSTVGTRLIVYFSDHDPKMADLRKELLISDSWHEADFSRVRDALTGYQCSISIDDIDLAGLREFLTGKEDFLVRLLENPLLLEHEAFTDLLQSVFHLTDELNHRKDLSALTRNDRMHLSVDICRAYHLLVVEWLQYMKYLKTNYPYLFSLAVRTNPFDEQASPMIA